MKEKFISVLSFALLYQFQHKIPRRETERERDAFHSKQPKKKHTSNSNVSRQVILTETRTVVPPFESIWEVIIIQYQEANLTSYLSRSYQSELPKLSARKERKQSPIDQLTLDFGNQSSRKRHKTIG